MTGCLVSLLLRLHKAEPKRHGVFGNIAKLAKLFKVSFGSSFLIDSSRVTGHIQLQTAQFSENLQTGSKKNSRQKEK